MLYQHQQYRQIKMNHLLPMKLIKIKFIQIQQLHQHQHLHHIIQLKSIHVNKKTRCFHFQFLSYIYIFLGESRVLSNSGNGIYPRKASISNSDIIENTTDSERISAANFGSQNPYTGASSEGSSAAVSRSHTPGRISSLNTYNVTNGLHEHLIDSGKGSSLLTGTSFDVLMNSLKSMREKDLDYLIHSSDDSLIHVTD